jgi:hypothetical protein
VDGSNRCVDRSELFGRSRVASSRSDFDKDVTVRPREASGRKFRD